MRAAERLGVGGADAGAAMTGATTTTARRTARPIGRRWKALDMGMADIVHYRVGQVRRVRRVAQVGGSRPDRPARPDRPGRPGPPPTVRPSPAGPFVKFAPAGTRICGH